jgi:hypothetical protein
MRDPKAFGILTETTLAQAYQGVMPKFVDSSVEDDICDPKAFGVLSQTTLAHQNPSRRFQKDWQRE